MRDVACALLAALLLATVAAEDFRVLGPAEDGQPKSSPAVRLDKTLPLTQHKPKARAGVLVARYIPQSKLPPDTILKFANITYRIVGEDMTMDNIRSRYELFELTFKKLYGMANLHAKIITVQPAIPGEGTQERPCGGDFGGCCLHKAPVADPATWAAIDVILEIGCSRESLWPDQGSLDWAQSRIIGTLFAQHGFHEVRCLLQRADVLPEGVHAHKYLPITALYTEETTVQFTGNSLSQWLPVDAATQNLILHSMDLIGLNRVAGCARIRLTKVFQQCNWEPGRGQIGIANVTFVTHREYPETTLPMAFAKTFHILLERLNEEGLNLAKIEVVANRIVKGPQWGNMHDQIESMLDEDDPIRTYETRVPVNDLPNFAPGKGPLPWTSILATLVVIAAGATYVHKKWRLLLFQSTSFKAKPPTVPLRSIGEELVDEIPDLSHKFMPRRESAPAAQGMQQMWERTVPYLPHAATQPPVLGKSQLHQPGSPSPLLEMPGLDPQHDPAAFDAFLEVLRNREDRTDLPMSGMSAAEATSGGSAHYLSRWSASTDSPNPFLAGAALPMHDSLPGSGRPQNFGTVPAAVVIQQGSLQDTEDTEQQRQEQLLRTQKLRERGVMFEQQLARADSVASWLLSGEEIEICLKEDGKRWLLGAGSYGKVYRGLRGGVQDVAVKVLHTTDEIQINQFCLEIKLLKSLSFDRNIVQFLGVCLHAGSPMLVLEFMEGGDLRQALSSPDAHKYHWDNLGQHVAMDVVRGLHFLHRNKVVHSDLKSRNVLLGRDGITAKLSDVGMSRILSGSRSAPVPGDVPGTFPYAAPELLLNQSCTVKADIFSLGVLFWEICTREIPVRGMLRRLRVPEECSVTVQALIEECMHFDPNKRPHAKEVFDRIRQADNSRVAAVPSLRSHEESFARLPSVDKSSGASSDSGRRLDAAMGVPS